MTVGQWKNALLNNGKYMTFGALGGFLRTPKNPPGYVPALCQAPSWYIQPFGHNGHGPKIGEGSPRPFGEGELRQSPGPRSTSIPSGMLMHLAVWPQYKWTENMGLCPLGGAGFHLTQCGLGRGLPACQVSSWSIQPFGHNTPTSQTGRLDRTDRQDNGPIAYRANRFINGRPKIHNKFTCELWLRKKTECRPDQQVSLIYTKHSLNKNQHISRALDSSRVKCPRYNFMYFLLLVCSDNVLMCIWFKGSRCSCYLTEPCYPAQRNLIEI